jgi:hypothetical protein
MRIRLLHSYSGALTNERRMAVGEHEVTEEFGVYLITNGHAVDITPVSDGRKHTEDIAIALTMGELDTEDAPVIVEPLPLAVDPDSDVDPLPEITEDVITQERTFTPKPKSKR